MSGWNWQQGAVALLWPATTGSATTLYSQSGVTIGATEYSLVNNSTSIASLTTVAYAFLMISSTDMLAGDEYEIAVQEKVISGGTQRRIVVASLVGPQVQPSIMPALPLMWGWDWTAKKISGTDRTFEWSIRAIT